MEDIRCFINWHKWKRNTDGVRVCKRCSVVHPVDWYEIVLKLRSDKVDK